MGRKSMLLAAVPAALLAVVLLSGLAMAAQGPAIPWWVVAGGGGHGEAGAFRLDATVGQGVAGTWSTAAWDLCAGFWCGPGGSYQIYLPLVGRGM